jgi:hypothetical protein
MISKKTKEPPYHVTCILEEYEIRKARNAQYSKRSFAIFLGIDSGTLSSILGGKRRLPEKLAKQICEKLQLKGVRRQKFIRSVLEDWGLKSLLKIQPPKLKMVNPPERDLLDVMTWEHSVLVPFITTPGFRADEAWIARRMGIEVSQVHDALERLVRLKLITPKKGGGWKREIKEGQDFQINPIRPEVTMKAVESSIRFLAENVKILDPSLCHFNAITLPVDPSKLEQARALIRDFVLRISGLLEGSNSTEIYHLGVALFPFTRPE